MVHCLETIKRLNDELLRAHFEREPDFEGGKRLTIAIDYDDTFTADPRAWTVVIQVLVAAGHRVVCVSSRRDTVEHQATLRRYLPTAVERIVLAYDMPKRKAARLFDIAVDIWIDDRPETIATKEEALKVVG
jgi:hypothetical protein